MIIRTRTIAVLHEEYFFETQRHYKTLSKRTSAYIKEHIKSKE